MATTQTIDLSAPTKNFVMEQGASVIIPFAATRNGEVMDLTGYLLRCQVRSSYSDSSVMINMTLANQKLVWVDQTKGTWNMILSPSDTNASNGKIRFGNDEDSISVVYDMELEAPGGVVFKVAKGTITINREVTR